MEILILRPSHQSQHGRLFKRGMNIWSGKHLEESCRRPAVNQFRNSLPGIYVHICRIVEAEKRSRAPGVAEIRPSISDGPAELLPLSQPRIPTRPA